MLKKYSIPIIMWLVFESIAVILWQALDNIFYLFNFSYIGTSIAIGLFLFARKQKYARHVIQFAVGLYMLGYLGFLQHENMQIEGFWYYLFLGVLPGEHAAGGLLVLSVPGLLYRRHHPLCRGQNLWPIYLRTRLVRLCLLDSYDP